jgi:hypothetical protein
VSEVPTAAGAGCGGAHRGASRSRGAAAGRPVPPLGEVRALMGPGRSARRTVRDSSATTGGVWACYEPCPTASTAASRDGQAVARHAAALAGATDGAAIRGTRARASASDENTRRTSRSRGVLERALDRRERDARGLALRDSRTRRWRSPGRRCLAGPPRRERDRVLVAVGEQPRLVPRDARRSGPPCGSRARAQLPPGVITASPWAALGIRALADSLAGLEDRRAARAVDRAVDAAPPMRLELAALTIASTSSRVMSPTLTTMRSPMWHGFIVNHTFSGPSIETRILPPRPQARTRQIPAPSPSVDLLGRRRARRGRPGMGETVGVTAQTARSSRGRHIARNRRSARASGRSSATT